MELFYRTKENPKSKRFSDALWELQVGGVQQREDVFAVASATDALLVSELVEWRAVRT